MMEAFDGDTPGHITMDNSINETFREELEHYLVNYLGPKHLPYQSLIPISVVYSIIFFTGLIGNFSTCIVIAKAHYMRTSTNYYLFNLAIADMLTLIFDHLLANVISLNVYIWATIRLTGVQSNLAFKWMHVPWIMFGIAAQVFGIISFLIEHKRLEVVEAISPADTGTSFPWQQLTRAFRGSERTLMWLQVDVGYSLIASSDWIMVKEHWGGRMLVMVFVVTTLPLTAWACECPQEAIALTQLASLIHLMASTHANLLVLNLSGIFATFIMIVYLGLVSLPPHYFYDVLSFSRTTLDEILQVYLPLIYPALLSRLFVLGFSDLSYIQSNMSHHHQERYQLHPET